jgi:hypothetical protein
MPVAVAPPFVVPGAKPRLDDDVLALVALHGDAAVDGVGLHPAGLGRIAEGHGRAVDAGFLSVTCGPAARRKASTVRVFMESSFYLEATMRSPFRVSSESRGPPRPMEVLEAVAAVDVAALAPARRRPRGKARDLEIAAQLAVQGLEREVGREVAPEGEAHFSIDGLELAVLRGAFGEGDAIRRSRSAHPPIRPRAPCRSGR